MDVPAVAVLGFVVSTLWKLLKASLINGGLLVDLANS